MGQINNLLTNYHCLTRYTLHAQWQSTEIQPLFTIHIDRIQMIEAVNSYTLGFGPHIGDSDASTGAQ